MTILPELSGDSWDDPFKSGRGRDPSISEIEGKHMYKRVLVPIDGSEIAERAWMKRSI